MALVVVDAENARRSLWPNLSREELLAGARAWARDHGHELVVVFDGAPPEEAPDVAGAPHADDAIVELLEHAETPAWLVTSDRALRARAAPHVERVIGGGTWVRTLATS